MTETALVGKPTKLTPILSKDIVKLIAAGNYISTACQANGISSQTYDNWLKWGEEGRQPYFTFFVAIKRAEAEAEASRVERVEQAGIGGGLVKRKTITTKGGSVIEEEQYAQPQWLADMTHLERRHPDRWGRKDRAKIDITEKRAITITHVEVVLNQGDGKQIVEGESRELKDDEARQIDKGS